MFRLIFRLVVIAGLCCGLALPCVAQNPVPLVQTLLILPFENHSQSPGLEWIGESFPEILSQRLSAPSMYIISREDRVYAFDRMGIPVAARPSHATLYRIAEQMDCDYVVMGDYNFDGSTFSARAMVLDMKQLRESAMLQASGPLVKLIDVQTDLAWQVLKTIKPGSTISLEEMMRSANPVRLDSFENYVRGIVAGTRQEKVRRFREAIRFNPQYTLAMFQLGKTYYTNREYDSAANWLSRIPQSEPKAGEAYFLLGLAYYNQGQFERAEEAFKVTISKLPLTEVYNNLGATALRRGKRSALPLLEKTVGVDPYDPDYRFNLALALYRFGDPALAVKNLRESLARYPTDSEARQFLEEISGAPAPATAKAAVAGPGSGAAGNRGGEPSGATVTSIAKLPLPRIKRNYDESSFRMLALEIQNSTKPVQEPGSDSRTMYHIQHGTELLDRGLTAEAEKEFHQALQMEPLSAAAHIGLARAAEAKGDTMTARMEAATSIGLHPTAAAYVVLARADMRQKQFASAGQNIERALALEPGNADALTLKQEIAARAAESTEWTR
jgi:tetratricopeptide (TPR) repeat protein/TolB-like protein